MEQATLDETLPVPPNMLLNVAGRKFKPMPKTTFRQDMYIGSLLRHAGLLKVASGFNAAADDLSEFAMDVIATAFEHGKLFDILGGIMQEDGVPWSIESAKANALFFSELTEDEDKRQLHGAIVGAIMGFFVSGALSMTNSQSSTVLSVAEPPTDLGSSNEPQSHPGQVLSEETKITESGTTSSEK